MSLSIDDAKEADEQAQEDGLRETPAGISEENQIDWDTEEVTQDVDLSPEALISFNHISKIEIETYGVEGNILDMEQNMQGAGMYGFDVLLSLANPTIEQGEMWVETDAEYPDRRIVGDPDGDTNPYEVRENVIRDSDGDIEDVETEGLGELPGGNTFDAQRTDLDCDHLTVTVSGSRATTVLGELDTAGRWFTTKEGTVAEGLFEVPPKFGTEQYDVEADPAPRLAGYPELRADMDGQRGAMLCKYDIEDATDADTRSPITLSMFKITDDGDFQSLSSLSPGDENYYKPQYPRTGNLYWDADSDGGQDFGADTEPESNGGVEAAKAQFSSSSSSEPEVSYEDLESAAQEFVDDTIDNIEQMPEPPEDSVTEVDDWDEHYGEKVVEMGITADQKDVEAVIDSQF